MLQDINLKALLLHFFTHKVALGFELRKPRQGIDQVLFPSPRHHGAQVGTDLVCSSARIFSLPCRGVVLDPIQELPDFIASELVEWNSTTPANPLSECRGVFLSRSLRWISRTEVLCNCCSESRRHCWTPAPPALAPMLDPLRPMALCYASC